jgi:SepF-like predicted cell division protein (DUF552 family)
MQDNKEKFTTSDEADIVTALFDSNLIDKTTLIPTEHEIKKYYEEHATFEPEQRLIHQIVIPSYNDAKELLERILQHLWVKMLFTEAIAMRMRK